MGRLTVLIGLFFMSLAVLSLTWPMVKQEMEPILVLSGQTFFVLFEEGVRMLREVLGMF